MGEGIGKRGGERIARTLATFGPVALFNFKYAAKCKMFN